MERRYNLYVVVLAACATFAVGCGVGAACSDTPAGPPSIRTEELIFEECLEKSRDAGAYQADVVDQCRRAAGQMVGRVPRTP